MNKREDLKKNIAKYIKQNNGELMYSEGFNNGGYEYSFINVKTNEIVKTFKEERYLKAFLTKQLKTI